MRKFKTFYLLAAIIASSFFYSCVPQQKAMSHKQQLAVLDSQLEQHSKKLKDLPVNITTIARGISFGGELEYTDEMTLARSIATRLPYENYLVKNSN